MPGRDKTGPIGQGAMTGRGLGFCQGNGVGNYRIGFRSGFGPGMGANYRCQRAYRRFNIEENIVSEKEYLQKQKDLLQEKVDLINKQIEKLS